MRIKHIGMYVTDIEGAKNFFIKYFNATSNPMYHNPKTGLKSYLLSFGDNGAKLEIMYRPYLSDLPKDIYRSGFIHIAIGVGSKEKVDSIYETLQHDGYQIQSEPRTTGDGFYECCVFGPENNLIEITI